MIITSSLNAGLIVCCDPTKVLKTKTNDFHLVIRLRFQSFNGEHYLLTNNSDATFCLLFQFDSVIQGNWVHPQCVLLSFIIFGLIELFYDCLLTNVLQQTLTPQLCHPCSTYKHRKTHYCGPFMEDCQSQRANTKTCVFICGETLDSENCFLANEKTTLLPISVSEGKAEGVCVDN